MWDENGDNETTSSLVFNLSIYNGNKRKLQKSKIEQELNRIENQRSILLMELERALEERMKIDKILLSSLNSLDDQLENKIDTLNQFYLKQQLGGSAFEEKMQVMREISVLKEARIGLLADFIMLGLDLLMLAETLKDDYSQEVAKEALFKNRKQLRAALFATVLGFILQIFVSLFPMVVYNKVIPNSAYQSLLTVALGMLIIITFDFIFKLIKTRIIDLATSTLN